MSQQAELKSFEMPTAEFDLSPMGISFEMQHFADRSLYDAFCTVMLRHDIPSKRVIRRYTLESFTKAAEGSVYQKVPDSIKTGKFDEDGIAALTTLLAGLGTLTYTGIRAAYTLNHNNRVLAYIDIATSTSEKRIELSIYGDAATVDQILDICQQNLELMADRTAERLTLQGDGSIARVQIPLKNPERYSNGLYPNVDMSPTGLMEKFLEADSRALLFYGQPGCGKSSFGTAMMVARGYMSVVMVDDNQLYDNPMFVNAIRECDDGTLFIFEDCDNLLRAREDGNRQMSALLSALSGVSERDFRMLFLTNLSNTKDIDPALLRPGRCMSAIRFDTFTQEQVPAVREAMGKDPFTTEEINSKTAWTLADIAHFGEGVVQTKFGF